MLVQKKPKRNPQEKTRNDINTRIMACQQLLLVKDLFKRHTLVEIENRTEDQENSSKRRDSESRAAMTDGEPKQVTQWPPSLFDLLP